MARGVPTVFSHAIGLAVMTAARETGRTPEEVCASLDLSAAEVRDPLRRFPHSELVRVWRTLDGQIYGFGLRAARIVGATPHSLTEYAMANAGTALLALRCYVRFQAMHHEAAAYALSIGRDRCVLRFALAAPHVLPHATADFLTAMHVRRMRSWIEGSAPPLVVRLSRPTLDAPELAAEEFPCPVEPGHPVAEIEWPRGLLDRPLAAAKPRLHQLLVAQIEAALGLPPSGVELPVMAVEQDDPVLALRRHFVTALPGGRASLDDAAHALATTTRSLQRRLAERGKRYQDILDESRRDLAKALLGDHKDPAEAALATGFSDLPAFTRAFRRWTGETPAAWATRNAGAAGGAIA
jgi:AraC-like DNA-binding protein